jgi:hypothetical protein
MPVASELRFVKRSTNGYEVVPIIMLICNINQNKKIHIQGDSEGCCQSLWVTHFNKLILSVESLIKIGPD